jgi:hypothetical protein
MSPAVASATPLVQAFLTEPPCACEHLPKKRAVLPREPIPMVM